MNNTRPYWKVIVSLTFSILATVFVIAAGISLARLLMPFVIGWLIASIANPVVCWLDKKMKIKRKFGSAIIIVAVIAIVTALLYIILSVVLRELAGLLMNLPDMYKELGKQLEIINKNITRLTRALPLGLRNGWDNISKAVGDAFTDWIAKQGKPTFSMAGKVTRQIPSVVIAMFVTLLSSYFFITDRESVIRWTKNVMPKPVYKRASMVIEHFRSAVGGYFKAQLKIMVVVAGILFAGILLAGVKYAIVIALLIALLDFLPFFGTGTALIPWGLYALLSGDYRRAVILVILYITTQIVRQLIQPKLVGDGVGLKPLPTLVFIYIGYRLGGFLWMILAVPIGMIIINMFRAGAFDYILDDVKILAKGIMDLRE